MVKRMLKVVAWMALAMLLVVGGSLTWAWFNQDKITAAILDEVNQSLAVEVQTGAPTLAWDQFPWIGVELKPVFIPGTLPNHPDTLLFAQSIQLQVHLWSAIRGNISLQGLRLADGLLRLEANAQGETNYNLFKPSEGDSTQSPTTTLEAIELANMQVDVRFPDIAVSGFLDAADFTGTLHQKGASGRWSANGNLQSLRISEQSYLNPSAFQSRGTLHQHTAEPAQVAAEVQLNKQSLALSWMRDTQQQSFEIKAEAMDLEEALRTLHRDLVGEFAPWEPTGKATVVFRTQDGPQPETRLTFHWPEGSLYVHPWKIRTQVREVHGEWSPDMLAIQSLTGTWGASTLQGSLRIDGFKKPKYAASIRAEGRIEDLTHLPGLDTLGASSGQFAMELKVQQQLAGRFNTLKSFAGVEAQGFLELAQAKLDLQQGGLLEDLNTHIDIENRNFKVDNLRFKRGKSDIYLTGTLVSAMDFFFLGQGYLDLVAQVKSQRFYMADWSTGTQNSSGSGLLPPYLKLDVDLNIERFFYKKLEAKDVQARIALRDQVLKAQPFSFAALGGNMQGELLLSQVQGPRYPMMLKGSWNKIDLKSLFFAMDDFGQQQLTHRNIEGKTTGSGECLLYLNESLAPEMPSLETRADIAIQQGRIVQFEPLNQLGNYLDAASVKDIRFEPVSTRVTIANQTVSIPPTALKNSALNLIMEGDYHFDNRVNYLFQFQLNELLQSRRKGQGEFDDYLEEQDNRKLSTIFVRMTGRIDNPTFSVDKKAMGNTLKEEIKQEGREIKELFQKKEEQPVKRTPFKYTWEEESDSTGSPQAPKLH